MANLDLLRAAAIGSVMVFHLGGVWGATTFYHATIWGARGVDLFFVLSGWLIGGLFWREARAFGNVQVTRFMLRRLIRTVPPYFAALVPAWLGARLVSGAAGQPVRFGWSYLAFIQNYVFAELPYFKPSWTLCVEEHFYLLMPGLLTLAALLLPRRAVPVLLLLACAASPALCVVYPPNVERGSSMTHWWMAGLALGVSASYVRYVEPRHWPVLQRWARRVAVPAAAYVLVNDYLPLGFQMRFGIMLCAMSCACVLVAVAELRPLPLARSRGVYFLALWSYSLYLTQTQVFGLGKLAASMVHLPAAAGAALLPALVVAAGATFHYVVEAPVIALRDRLVPRRPPLKNPTPDLDPGV